MNTDIVLGIAKRIRAMPDRAFPFNVVVASATIDPAAFLTFFGGRASVINVPGRTHPVTVEYSPGDDLVPACLDALVAHPVGNLMAFLSGQREVPSAISS